MLKKSEIAILKTLVEQKEMTSAEIANVVNDEIEVTLEKIQQILGYLSAGEYVVQQKSGDKYTYQLGDEGIKLLEMIEEQKRTSEEIRYLWKEVKVAFGFGKRKNNKDTFIP